MEVLISTRREEPPKVQVSDVKLETPPNRKPVWHSEPVQTKKRFTPRGMKGRKQKCPGSVGSGATLKRKPASPKR